MAVTMRDRWTDDRLDDLNGKVDDGFKRMDEQFARVDKKFDRIDARFERLDERLARDFGRIDSRLDALGHQIIWGALMFSGVLVAGFVAILTKL